MPLSTDRADDDTWLRTLSAAHHAKLVRYISNMLYPNFHDLAPLAVNDALHLAVKHRGELDDDPLRWLYIVATNQARTRMRQERRFSDRQTPLDVLDDEPVVAEPGEKILINDSFQELVKTLNPVDRQLLWLTDVDKLPHAEVAAILAEIFKVPYSANLVTQRRGRALDRLGADPMVQERHRLQRLRPIPPRKGDDA
ncbi:sigma-70 family RNA polymerase sigma factor [Hamadaea sp. NPDC050747]|uniref:RNA polymerase sigma factor n=1 Tax=Hamadaea sp. NPDC050747 TaxID=3155789 RepID=UPI0033FBC653